MKFDEITDGINQVLIEPFNNGSSKDEIVRSFAFSLGAFMHSDGTRQDKEELNTIMLKGIEDGRKDIEKFIHRAAN